MNKKLSNLSGIVALASALVVGCSNSNGNDGSTSTQDSKAQTQQVRGSGDLKVIKGSAKPSVVAGQLGGKQLSSWPEGVSLPEGAKISETSSTANGGDVILVAPDPKATLDDLQSQLAGVGLKPISIDEDMAAFAGGGWTIDLYLEPDDTIDMSWTVHNV